MAKMFRIQLSPKELMVDVTTRTGIEKKSAREVELTMMKNCFEMAADGKKSFKEVNLCMDCVGQLEGIADNKTFIDFTKADVDFLSDGFEKSAGQGRPTVWYKLTELFEQLENPQEAPIGTGPEVEPKGK